MYHQHSRRTMNKILGPKSRMPIEIYCTTINGTGYVYVLRPLCGCGACALDVITDYEARRSTLSLELHIIDSFPSRHLILIEVSQCCSLFKTYFQNSGPRNKFPYMSAPSHGLSFRSSYSVLTESNAFHCNFFYLSFVYMPCQ